MHEHAGTAAVEGEQKKRREEGAGAARVVSNVCPGGRQPSRENAHLCDISVSLRSRPSASRRARVPSRAPTFRFVSCLSLRLVCHV